MDIQDKRILQQAHLNEQENYFKKLTKSLPNADNKYEYIEIDHDPIGLIHKLKNPDRQIQESSPAGVSKQTNTDEESTQADTDFDDGDIGE